MSVIAASKEKLTNCYGRAFTKGIFKIMHVEIVRVSRIEVDVS